MTDDPKFRAGVKAGDRPRTRSGDHYVGCVYNSCDPRCKCALPSPAPLADDSAARAREAFDATREKGTVFWRELTPFWQRRLTTMLAFARTPATVASGGVEVADSADYKRTFFGILNKDGGFWTPIAFADERAAKAHINAFFADRYQLETALAELKIVPVRSRLSLPAAPTDAEGEDHG